MRVRVSPIPPPFFRGHRSTVGPQSSKLPMWVRFPLPAPSRFSERSAVCKTAREGLIPSRLSAPRARWTSTRLLSEPIRVRVPGGAPCNAELPDLPDAGTGLRNRLSRFDSSQGGRGIFCRRYPRPGGSRHERPKLVVRVQLPAGVLRLRCVPRRMPGLISPRAKVRLLPQRRTSTFIWVWLNLARALGSEPRDCEFESRHPDPRGARHLVMAPVLQTGRGEGPLRLRLRGSHCTPSTSWTPYSSNDPLAPYQPRT